MRVWPYAPRLNAMASTKSSDHYKGTLCKKCNEVFKHPVLLPCLHTFCKECISGLKKTVDSKDLVCCLSCDGTTPMPPEGGLESFPPNLHMEREANIVRYGRLMKKRPPPVCDECSREPALETVSFCCTCMSFLCQQCHQQHLLSRKIALNHKVLLLKDTPDIEAQLRQNMSVFTAGRICTQHAKEEIKLYCNQCEKLLCIQCALTQHSGHTMEDLNVFVNRGKGEIAGKLEKMPCVVEKLDELINGGKTVCESIKARKKAVDDEIIKIFAELYKNLDERKAGLLQQCSEIATRKITTQTSQINELSFLKNAIVAGMQFFDSSKEEYNDSEFIPVMATILTRVSELEKKAEQLSLSLVSLVENDNIWHNSDAAGVVSILSTFQIASFVPREYTKLCNPIKIKTHYAYHLAVCESGDIIVANHTGNTIEVYGHTGTIKATFQSGGSYPVGVHVVGDILYTVEHSSNVCCKMTVKGERLMVIGNGQLSNPWGCTVDKNGTLYVASTGSNQVQAFNQNGTFLKTLCSVSSPRDVTIDQQQCVHVTTFPPGCIKVFDVDGKFIREYGKGILSQPSGVAIDRQGFCLVGDWAGRSFHVFDPHGEHIHKIAFNGSVCGVAIDSKNNVYVVDNSNQYVHKY